MDSTSEKDCSKFPFSALVPSGPISYTLQHHSRKTTISGCSASNKMKIQGRRNHRKRRNHREKKVIRNKAATGWQETASLPSRTVQSS